MRHCTERVDKTPSATGSGGQAAVADDNVTIAACSQSLRPKPTRNASATSHKAIRGDVRHLPHTKADTDTFDARKCSWILGMFTTGEEHPISDRGSPRELIRM